MRSPREAVETYIRAKDGNRPYLMERAFAENTILEMIVKAGTVSFPAVSRGLPSVADVLVRRFGQTYENVHTFCLAPPPLKNERGYSCIWLVGMSEKDSRTVRVGCGQYDWSFHPQAPYLVERLTITVEQMQSLAPRSLASIMKWLARLPYPWCTAKTAVRELPALDELQPIRQYIGRESA